jgi:hypothetical protein
MHRHFLSSTRSREENNYNYFGAERIGEHAADFACSAAVGNYA